VSGEEKKLVSADVAPVNHLPVFHTQGGSVTTRCTLIRHAHPYRIDDADGEGQPPSLNRKRRLNVAAWPRWHSLHAPIPACVDGAKS
jgi:hypothetical protein